jgi:hypothetical protein
VFWLLLMLTFTLHVDDERRARRFIIGAAARWLGARQRARRAARGADRPRDAGGDCRRRDLGVAALLFLRSNKPGLLLLLG